MSTTGMTDNRTRRSLVWSALKGEAGDVTKGPLRRAVLLLAVPMVLEMCMESVFAVVDIFFVSRLGSAAMAAVGLTESLLTIVYALAIGLSIGVTAMVARRTGEGDGRGAAHATAQGIVLGLSIATVMGVLGAWHAESLLRLLGASEPVIAIGVGYTRVMLGGQAVIMMLFLLNAAFRGAGDAAIAMRVLWLGNLFNIVLDPLLIFGIGPFPELGVTGAAVATTIGRGVAVAAQLVVLARGRGRIRMRARDLLPAPRVMGTLLSLSGTGTLQTLIGTASWIGLVRIIAEYGSEAVAGYTIAVRIVMFALLPAWGLANAAATMVGQSLGARDPERAEAAVWLAGRLNLYFLGTTGLLFMVAAPWIAGWFGGDVATRANAVLCLRIVSAGFIFYSYGMVLTQSFNGAGAVWTPTILNVLCFWLFEIPLAWVLSQSFGPAGVFAAISAAFSVLAVASAVLFRRGAWKRARV